MGKFLIITRADAKVSSYTKLTLPIFQKFANKWGADMKILDHEPPFLTDDNNPHYRILKVQELLEKYDRILCLDADMIINKNCPNIFEVVPANKIGSIYEDVGSRQAHRRGLIQQIQKIWGNVEWKTGYTNAGTFLVSKGHQKIFNPHNKKYWTDWGSADVHLSYNIHKHKLEVHRLPFQFNHMIMFSEPWNNNANRFKSYIIHYAGRGVFEKNKIKNKLEQIQSDYEMIYG